jgi:DNA-binding protein YbaB
VVALAGALGGLAHALRSLFWYTGNRALKSSWLLMYGLLPFIGASLAVITYMVLRGGVFLVSTQTSADVANPFGYAALAGLVGLFSSEAAEWLRNVFAQVFTTASEGKDATKEATKPTIAKTQPPHESAGGAVVITGMGLAEVTSVTFDKVPAEFEMVSDTELKATVPDGVATGPVTVTVTTPAGAASTPFTVDAPGRLTGLLRSLPDRLRRLLGEGPPSET